MRTTVLFTLLVAALLTTIAHAQRPNRPARGDFRRMPDKLKTGDPAPDFTLKLMDGKEVVTLSKFKGDRPVALVFGSYT